MNQEFETKVDELLLRLERMGMYDYSEARSILSDFKILCHLNAKKLNVFVTEHVDEIENSLDRSEKYRRAPEKLSNWQDAKRGLESDIDSLKRKGY